MPRFDTDRHWARLSTRSALLLPVSWLFRLAVEARRFAFRAGWAKREAVGVPVIVVGNVTVGGTGKTPLTIWLVLYLITRGWHPGVVSRGYGGSASDERVSEPVGRHSDPQRVGDEPVLIARRTPAPVWIGVDRVFAARALLREHPEVDVLVADDGLQHYRLAREVEIAVVDAALGFGNGHMLPSGPLREPVHRLAAVDALVINGAADIDSPVPRAAQFEMRIAASRVYRLDDPAVIAAPESLRGQRLHAVAGIGYPDRFFALLESLGLTFVEHPFPDHHRFEPADLDFGDEPVILTEKDAVKCVRFATARHWVLAIEAQVDAAFGEHLVHCLERRA
ncbi:MAG: tetraacyldisaccharide 4'-kinase [bacterium]|jgi:tetraacyldisaccharide 4'-kinase|nr:tetraacyldisaccharide 4'-kinase [Betaproteobacteria bacterium]